MNLFKISLLSLFISFSIIVPKSFVVAETNQSTLVATVNIENTRIVSQDKNNFNIAFGLSNREGLQTGVKYGVQLISENGKYIADEKVYEESLTLNENTTIKREVVYSAPSNLDGSYTLVLSSRSESNFPFAVSSLGKVKLTASTKGVQILNESCYLQVEGEKGNPHYTLTQSIDINSAETLKLTCNAINRADLPMTVIPFFETKYSSAYGNTAKQIGGDYTPMAFKKGETKTFSISLPKADAPQFYNLKVKLLSSDNFSNTVSVKYIISGISASVQKLSLDKDYYKAGDKGAVSLIWVASSGSFQRSGLKGAKIPEVSLKVIIAGENGRECVEPIEKVLVRDAKSPENVIPFEVKATCTNPKVSVSLSDDKENVLDEKEFNFKSSTSENPTPISKTTILTIIVALLAILVVGIYMKKKKANVTM